MGGVSWAEGCIDFVLNDIQHFPKSSLLNYPSPFQSAQTGKFMQFGNFGGSAAMIGLVSLTDYLSNIFSPNLSSLM